MQFGPRWSGGRDWRRGEEGGEEIGQERRERSVRPSHERRGWAVELRSGAAKRKSNAGIGAVWVGLCSMCSSFIVDAVYRTIFGFVNFRPVNIR